MIVNLYVDHMISPPPQSAEQVWQATNEHPQTFTAAAKAIGLTSEEYREFRNDLLKGKSLYVRLPHHFAAMAGDRHGSVYAVKHAVLPGTAYGWEIKLHDGTKVYVPQSCGNLSLVRSRVEAVAIKPASHHKTVAVVIPSAPSTQVSVVETPVPEVNPTPIAETPQATSSHPISPLYAIPVIGAILIGLQHHDTPSNVPPCSQGSNSMGVCRK